MDAVVNWLDRLFWTEALRPGLLVDLTANVFGLKLLFGIALSQNRVPSTGGSQYQGRVDAGWRAPAPLA